MSLLKNRKSPVPTIRAKESAANSRTFPAIPGRAFSRRHLLLLVVVAGALMALLAGGDMGRPARAAATLQNPAPAPTPDYSNVNDILNGRRDLLRADDFAVVAEGGGAQTAFRILQTTNSAISNDLPVDATAIGYIPEHDSSTTLTGRMFAFAADVVVTVVYSKENPNKATVSVYSPVAKSSTQIDLSYPDIVVFGMKMADFNRDGFDDLVINYSSPGLASNILIINAKNVNAFAEGLVAREIQGNSVRFSPDAMTVGDFNGDGRLEIVGVTSQALGSSDDGNGLRLAVHLVDEKTLQIYGVTVFQLNNPDGTPIEPSALVPFTSAAAGKFTSTAHDQFLIAYATNEGTAKVELIDFDPATGFKPIGRSSWDTGHEIKTGHYGVYNWTGLLRLRAGRFSWGAQSDQALLLHGNNFHRDLGSSSYDFTLSSLAINPVDFSIKEQGNFQTGDNSGTIYGLELGNFDRRDPDPQNPQQKDRNPNLQAALLSTSVDGYTGYVNIYDIDPTTSAPKQATTTYQFSMDTAADRMLFAAGDMQGRSMRLGEPTKVVVNGTAQPTVVAAAPPMHVAYAAPVGENKQQVLNLSAVPDSFTTSYETEEKSSNQSSSTHTTSWSWGAKESYEGSFEIGDVDAGDGLKYSETFSAAQDLKGSTANTHGTYSTHSFDISQQTGFSDQLWYSQTRFNIYIYPVIGKTVLACPANKPNCQENEKIEQPLTIQFSGPDHISSETVAASQVEWYQPPWEYGNLLSYPGSYAQLRQIVPDIDKLSIDLTWATDQSNLTVKTTWATGTSTSQSTSFEQNYSFENDFSVQSAAGALGFDTVNLTSDYDTSGSFGFSNLNKSTTNLGKSTGISVHKPGSFLDPPNYGYYVTPYIFGQKKPGGSVDNALLTSDVQTFGLLRTAFSVDPTRGDAGGWWGRAYTTSPDVGLNHPNRWTITSPGLVTPPATIPLNCLAVGSGSSQMNCATLAASQPNDPWTSSFHDMRGLFITNATHPGQGPQLETATAGDKLTLQARVYNFSLAPMDPGARVHVRFYGMPWDTSKHSPAGDSFLIDKEDVLSPIPPFSSNPDGAPLNWVLAETTLDTTPYADKYLVFWVVVWSQTADGKLAPELPGHGLTAIPAVLNNLVDASKIEETYSNNVGFYKFPFYVFKPSNGGPLLGAPNGPGDVRLGGVNVSGRRIEAGQSVEVSAPLRVGGRSVSGVTAVFYDGDPQRGGTAFDVERISHLRAGDTHQVRVRFTPRACSAHQVFISIGKGTPFEATGASAPVEVGCNQAPPACSTVCQRSPQYYLNNLSRLPNGTVQVAGGGLTSTISTGNAAQMRLALGGGTSAQARFNQQFVAAQLSLLAAPGGDQAALQSPLSCYRLEFAPVRMRDGSTLSPSSSLGELLGQARNSARGSGAADLLALAAILGQLNGNDPTGQCHTGRAP